MLFTRNALAAVFLTALLAGGLLAPAGPSAAKCPPGSKAVEDMASGKVTCEEEDVLDTRSLRRRSLGKPGVPGRPGVPGQPGRPGRPAAPRRAKCAGASSDCGLAKWGCEEACRKTYLSTATGAASQSSQRSKVALGACLRVCGEEFACPAKEPEVSGK